MKKKRSFLKWAGGKYLLADKIIPHLPEGEQLIEPFVGAGTFFLNTHYNHYLLADINADLISLFKFVKKAPKNFISDAKTYFDTKNNHQTAFYHLREQFNNSHNDYERALIFLYLNRHCYNGLCRYNQKGKFNVPFGYYKKPYFPEDEIYFFAEKAQKAQFICAPYPKTLAKAKSHSVIYCDPPYAPLSKTANFTSYHSNNFTIDDQLMLTTLIDKLVEKKNIVAVISNHDTPNTRLWYKNAMIYTVKANRLISCKTRDKVNELIAIFHNNHN